MLCCSEHQGPVLSQGLAEDVPDSAVPWAGDLLAPMDPGPEWGGGRGLLAVVKETGRGWDGEAGFTGFADFNGVHTLIMTDFKPPMLN